MMLAARDGTLFPQQRCVPLGSNFLLREARQGPQAVRALHHAGGRR